MKKIILALFSVVALSTLAGCLEETASDRAQKKQVANQMNVKVKAVDSVPAPVIDNYQAREAVAKFMDRVNAKGQVWYVYKENAFTGEVIQAFTSSIYPMSVCSFMTPTEEVKYKGTGSNRVATVTNAIALDGLYYKGGECPTFFFDLVTDTLVVSDEGSILSAQDQPRDIDIEFTTFREDKLSK